MSKNYYHKEDEYDEEIDDEEIDKIIKDYYNDYKKDNKELIDQKSSLNLDNNQKIAIGILGFFAVTIIIMWFIQFKRSLERPFNTFSDSSSKQQVQVNDNTCLGPNCSLQKESDLHNKDTDKDGLSDWDELNVYYTSPYLEDTDSDGFTDKEEIDSGNDPNCPAGRDCSEQTIKTNDNNQLEAADFKNENLSLDQISNGLNSVSDSELEKILQGQADAKTLRQALINSGASEEALNKISDEDLLKAYQQMLNNNE